jgi:hypothetical protein
MESLLLTCFCNVKSGVNENMKCQDVVKINAFLNWVIYIIPGEIGILNENYEKIAYLSGNTDRLNRNHKYTIYVKNGQPYVYIESGVNIPVCLRLIPKNVLFIQNTPDPRHSFGNYSINYEHKVVNVDID